MGIILFDYCFFTLIAFFGRERKSQCNQHSVSFDGCSGVTARTTWRLAVLFMLTTPSQPFLPSFTPFLIRCFTLEVKDSIFLIVDSCCWSTPCTCINSPYNTPLFHIIPAFIHDTCLQSQQRSKIPSFVLSYCVLLCSCLVLSGSIVE
ncbi:hypothetical protein BDW69DRAFT_144741 [Aspergillus filifer]